MIPRPASSEHAPYYGRYISRVPECDILELLQTQNRDTLALLDDIGEKRGSYRYEPGKWSIKQVIGHVTDVERVFTYRGLVFSRGDSTPQAGIEQDDWAMAANHDDRSLADVAAELASVRAATLTLFRSFSDDMWSRSGTASDCRFTARAVPWIIAGHELHHVNVIRERYLG